MPVKRATRVTQPDLGEEQLAKLNSAITTGAELNESVGPDDWPTGVDMAELDHRGYVVVYHRRTREPSVIMVDALSKQLKKIDKLEDGGDGKSYAFTLDKPKQAPYRGILKCYLHADDSDRPKWDGFGFIVCRKNNLPTEFQRRMHMQRKHKQEWASIQADKAERETADRREFEKQLIAAVQRGAPVSAAAAALEA